MGCPFTIRIARFTYSSSKLLFYFIGPEVQKPRGSSGACDHFPLGKLSYIIKLMTPPKNPILDKFPSFFLLAPVTQFKLNFHLKVV
jgi:hypothetical protein